MTGITPAAPAANNPELNPGGGHLNPRPRQFGGRNVERLQSAAAHGDEEAFKTLKQLDTSIYPDFLR